MTEQQKLKPISEVLRSPRFQKEVSLMLFFFAALSAIYCVFLFAANHSEEVFVTAVGMLVQTIVYAVLAILIRRGSVKALVLTGFLFAANIVLTLFGPSWEDAKGIVIVYGLLIAVLIRFIRRERRAGPAEGEP
jgi:drug/metabolite transporter (DMT)-like permease